MARSKTTWSTQEAREAAALSLPKARAAAAAKRAQLERSKAAKAAGNGATIAGPVYLDSTLHRTRAHVSKLQDKLEAQLEKSAIDGATVRDICRAIKDLAELERVLDGRPAPGTLRPSTAAPRPSARVPLQPLKPLERDEPPGLTERPEW